MAQHWAAVASYASKVLGVGPRSGEDIAQEVFLKLWAGDIRWSGEGSSRAFLLGVTRNLCLNRRRKESLRKRLSDKVRTQFQLWQRMPNPGEDLQASELQRRLDVVLESMPARRREVFLLIRMQGLSYAEVAEIMGISAQTVANQMTLALKQLRQAL
ncbi:MAG: sigma-70 family RNA polymerase sigma factor [Gemmatimonadota bacterium]